MKKRVLILCTGNSARSQMAEGLLRHMAGDQYEVFSAGSKPSVVNPFAIQAMDELRIDIRGQRSKHVSEFFQQSFDYVMTVCSAAAETCPVFPGRGHYIHWDFPDPAAVVGTDSEKLAAFQEVRDAIRERLQIWLGEQERAR